MGSVSLGQLRAFVVVVDEGGFGAAADELGLTQSSVSHALAALEENVGGPLVVRSQPPVPTALGAAVLDHARATLASARAFDAAAARHLDGELPTKCKLSVSRTAARGLMPDLMKAWHAHQPDLELDIYEGVGAELEVWLASGLVDAAILIDPSPVPEGAVLVGTDTVQALVPIADASAGHSPIHLEDLHSDPVLVCTSGCETYVRRVYADAGARYDPAQRIRDLTTLISMVEAGIGVSIVPSLTAALLPPSLALVPIEPTIERRLYLCGPTNRPWHPVVAILQQVATSSFDLPLRR